MPAAQTQGQTEPRSHYAFTPTVKAIQARKGSRASYQRMEERSVEYDSDAGARCLHRSADLVLHGDGDRRRPALHPAPRRPAGFLHVLDDKTLAFADFAGNRQYLTQGNLAENPKAHLFLIDYVNRQRIKIWGTAKVVENDPELLAKLMPQGYKARAEQVIVFTITAWDSNCPQHIPQKLDLADVVAVVAERDKRIAELEAEVARLKAAVPA